MTEILLIAAVARNGAIGRGNELLFRDPADQRHFRETTTGCPVIMGRRTWESVPERFRPLPRRRNIVLSRDPTFVAPGGETVATLEAALQRVADAPRVFVIGGADLYALALPLAHELVMTEIDADLPGDRFFPTWDRSLFHETARQTLTSADGTPFAFVNYRRR